MLHSAATKIHLDYLRLPRFAGGGRDNCEGLERNDRSDVDNVEADDEVEEVEEVEVEAYADEVDEELAILEG